MTLYLITVFLLTLSNLPSSTIGDTAIALKENYRKEFKMIVEGTGNFRHLVHRSGLFVDKTLLIRELLEDMLDRILTLNYPRNWGKSVNLHMLKIFMEIQVDKKGNRLAPLNETRNYRLFKYGELVDENGEVEKLRKPLMIAEDDIIIREFLGRVPVVYLNLSDINPGTGFDDLQTEFVNRVGDCFAEHEYMKEVLQEIIDNKNASDNERKLAQKNLALFRTILWKEASPTELQKSLNFLSKLLAEHFKKKVFILVDGYDAPFNNTFLCGTFPRSQEETFLDFYRKFNFFTFVSNPSMFRSILTGVIPLGEGNLLSGLRREVTEMTVLNDTMIHKYYGFTRDRVDDLFQLYKLDKNVTKKAIQLYHGHSIGSMTKIKIVEPLPIVHLLNKGQFLRSEASFLKKYYQVDSIRLVFNALFSGLQLPAQFTNVTLSREDFKNLQDAPYYNEKICGPVLQSFLRYSFAAGYLTTGHVSMTEFQALNKIITVRLATGEMFVTMGEGLAVYYGNRFQVDMEEVKDICIRFHDDLSTFVKNNDTTSAKLISTMEQFFSYIFRPRGFLANENEEMTNAILDYLTIFVNSYRRIPSFGPEILLFEHDIGIVIGGTFNRTSPDEALEIATKGEQKLSHLRLPKYKFIGINAKPNSTIEMKATVKYTGHSSV